MHVCLLVGTSENPDFYKTKVVIVGFKGLLPIRWFYAPPPKKINLCPTVLLPQLWSMSAY